MRHRRDGWKLGRLSGHRQALFRNQLTALFRHETITTTEAKAKALRPLADHVVTLAKRDSLHARRQALALVPDVAVVHRLFDAIGARYADRRGGYTRIIAAGTRRGDAAPLAILELVDRPTASSDAAGKAKGKKAATPKGKEAKKARKAAAAAGG
jgi:large subunit ribosomal protein L17